MKQKLNNQALHFKLDDFVSRYFDCDVGAIGSERTLHVIIYYFILRSHNCLRYNIQILKINMDIYFLFFYMLLFFGYRDTGMDMTPYLYPEIKLFTVKTLKQIQ
jgi:hypothetical protein